MNHATERRLFKILVGLIVVAVLVLLSLAWHQSYTTANKQKHEIDNTKTLLRNDFCDFFNLLLKAPTTGPTTAYGRQLRQQYIVMYNRIGCSTKGGGE